MTTHTYIEVQETAAKLQSTPIASPTFSAAVYDLRALVYYAVFIPSRYKRGHQQKSITAVNARRVIIFLMLSLIFARGLIVIGVSESAAW